MGDSSKIANEFQTSSNNFYGQGVQAPRNKTLARIIHKPMLSNAVFARKQRRGNAHTKMRALTRAIWVASMPSMRGRFVQHLEMCGSQMFLQVALHFLSVCDHSSSLGKYLAM
jgi:hypothetical protein